jgi:hypothetical protein
MRLSVVVLGLTAACNGRSIPADSSMPAIQAGCRFDAPVDAAKVVAAAALEGQLFYVHADGSNRVAYTFAGVAGASAPSTWSHSILSRGRFVAGGAVSSSADFQSWRQELVLLDLDSKVITKLSWDSAPAVVPYLNEQGMLALDLGGTGAQLIDSDGTARTLPNLTPIAEPTADGDLPVYGALGVGSTPYGWVRAGATTMTLLRHPRAATAPDVSYLGGRLVYLGQVEGDIAVVSEGPNDARVIALPQSTGVDLAITDSVASGWVLVGGYQQPLFRVNVQTAEVVQVGLDTPSGLRKFQGGVFGPALDQDGALLSALRDDYSGALYRSTDGDHWSRIGGTVSNVLDIVGLERGGTYLISGTNARYAEEEWTPPTTAGNQPDLSGESLQVVRPADSVRRVADGAATWEDVLPSQISADGLCVAYWQHIDEQTLGLRALDVERGRLFDLLPIVETNPQDSMTWIP